MTRHLDVLGDTLLDVDVDTTAERLVPDSAAPVLEEVDASSISALIDSRRWRDSTVNLHVDQGANS